MIHAVNRISTDDAAVTIFNVSRALLVPTTSPIATEHITEIINSNSPFSITLANVVLRPSSSKRKYLKTKGSKEKRTLNKAHRVSFAFMQKPQIVQGIEPNE
jgi:hypothetical protein